MKISKTQKRILSTMDETWKSAYELKCGLSTLKALRRIGFVESRNHDTPGAFSMPRTHIKWRKNSDSNHSDSN